MLNFTGSFRKALGEALVTLGEINRNIFVIDTDLSKSTRSSIFQKRFPDRFIQVGISEQDAIGMAAGLAIGGKIPIIVSYSMFILRGWEQIRNTVARDNLNVKIVGTHSGLSDFRDGSSHQCFEDIGLTRILPNFKVISPSDEVSTKSLIRQAVEEYGPTYIRLGRDNTNKIYIDEEDVELGKGSVLRDWGDIVLISHGSMTSISLIVADMLERDGYKAGVIDMHTIKPLDRELLKRIDTPIFVIEDHSIYCGLGSAIAEFISTYRPRYVFRLGIEDRFGSGERTYTDLLRFMGLTPEELFKKIRVVMDGI